MKGGNLINLFKSKKTITSALILSLLIVPLSTTAYANANEINDSKNESTQSDSSKEDLQNQLKELGEKYGFSLESETPSNEKNLKMSNDNNSDTLDFNSVEELEEFLKESSSVESKSINTYNILDESGVEHVLNQQEFINLLDSQSIEYSVNPDGSLNFNYDDLTVDSSMLKNISSNQNLKAARVASSGTSSYSFTSDSKVFNLFYKRNMDMKYEWKRVPQGGNPGSRQFVRVYNRSAYPTGIYVADWTNKEYSQTYTNSRHTVNNSVRGQWKLKVGVNGFSANFVRPETWNFSCTIY